MYNQTPEQTVSEAILNKQGFRFSNWISAQDEDDSLGCMVMVKHSKPGRTEYREIAPDGSVN